MHPAAGVGARERERERAAAVRAHPPRDAAPAGRRDGHAHALAGPEPGPAHAERVAAGRHEPRAVRGRLMRGGRRLAAGAGDRDPDAEGDEDGGDGEGAGERHGLLMVAGQRGPGITAWSAQLTTLTTMAARSPAPNEAISKSATSQSVT